MSDVFSAREMPQNKPSRTGFSVMAASLAWVRLLKSEFSERGVSGVFNTCSRFIGIALQYSQHREIVKTISGPHTKGIFAVHPRVAYKYTMPYLSLGFSRDTRWTMLKGHYQFLNESLSEAFFSRVLNNTLTLWQEKVGEHSFSVSVEGPCLQTKHREGDLTFVFNMNDAPLYKISFSIIPSSSLAALKQFPQAQSRNVLYVGRVQGVPGNFHLIREATKVCHEVSPPDVLMAAIAGAAAALDIDVVAGVALENSISLKVLVHSNMSFDYTEFWTRYNGEKTPDGHYLIALPFFEKPIGLIESKHRKRTLAKRGFKKELSAFVKEEMEKMVIRR